MNYKQCKSVLIRVFFIMLDALKDLPICARRFPSGDANRKTKVKNRK